MKKILLLNFIMLLCVTFGFAQTQQRSPFTLSPQWMIGRLSGMTFVQADKSIGNPINLTGNPAANSGQEATTTLCLPDKSILVYCNDAQIYTSANTIFSNVNGGNGQSSTDGAVSIPDPNDTTQFYIFSGNDMTGGNQGGINAYLIKKVGTVYTLVSGPTSLATSGQVSEGLFATADGSGGYWLIAHTQAATNFYSWHITKTGVGTRVSSPTSTRGGFGAGGTIIINKCQDRIALVGSQEIEVRAWDKSSGMAGAIIQFSGLGAISSGYSGEFSPDGNILYYSALNGTLQQWDLTKSFATGVVPITGANTINGMQLGPNDRIYITRATTNIASINNPNVIGTGCTYVQNSLTVTGTGPYIGLANEAWLNPNYPVISKTVTGDCKTYTFDYKFKTYFKDTITTVLNSEVWNFGDATGDITGLGHKPSHTFPSTGTYLVTLTTTDATCNQKWKDTIYVSPNCSLPVKFIKFSSKLNDNSVQLNWTTAYEINVDKFEVQVSYDGKNFKTIKVVKAAPGNSNNFQNYVAYDNSPAYGYNYYRIVSYDNGSVVPMYSTIIAQNVTYNITPKIIVTQSNNDNFHVILQGIIGEHHNVIVYDVTGRVVKEFYTDDEEFDFGADINAGYYTILVVTVDQREFIHVIKK